MGEGGGALAKGLALSAISGTLSYRILKLCRVLEIFRKVSENLKLAKPLLFHYHGNCSMTYLSYRNWKPTNFQMLPETKKLKL